MVSSYTFKKPVYVNKVKMLIFFSSVAILYSIFGMLKKINFFVKSFGFMFSGYSFKKAKKQFVFENIVMIFDSLNLLKKNQRVLDLYCKNRDCQYSEKDIYKIKGKNFKEVLEVFNNFWAVQKLDRTFTGVTHCFTPKKDFGICPLKS